MTTKTGVISDGYFNYINCIHGCSRLTIIPPAGADELTTVHKLISLLDLFQGEKMNRYVKLFNLFLVK